MSPARGRRLRGMDERRSDRVTWRTVTLEPGEVRPYDPAEWVDALVVLEEGSVELEGMAGTRRRVAKGAVLWLAGLPLRAVHNIGRHPAVLVAVSRRLRE